MFENIKKFFKKTNKKEVINASSKETAKERLHLVLMQDRANVSADFLDLMREEIIEVIKKYIEVDETAIDVRLTNQSNEDGTQGAPALYANIPILNIKDKNKKIKKENEIISKEEEKSKEIKENPIEKNEENKKTKEKKKKSPKSDEIKDDKQNEEKETKEETGDILEENIMKKESKDE